MGPRLGWSRRERYGAVRARPGGAGAWWRAAADGAVPSPCSNAASSRARGRLVLSRNLASLGRGGMHLRGCKISRESCSEPEPDPRPPRGAAPAPGLTRVQPRRRPGAGADRGAFAAAATRRASGGGSLQVAAIGQSRGRRPPCSSRPAAQTVRARRRLLLICCSVADSRWLTTNYY